MLINRRVVFYPAALNSPVPIYTPGWREPRHCESKVSYPRTGHNVPGQGSSPDILLLLCQISFDFRRGRQRSRVVSVSDSRSGGPGFESRSGYYLDLIPGSPEFKSSATLVNSQLVSLGPVGILNNVMFNLDDLFLLFARPH